MNGRKPLKFHINNVFLLRVSGEKTIKKLLMPKQLIFGKRHQVHQVEKYR